MLPRLEPTILAVVAISSEEHLRFDEENAVVQHQQTTIVANVAMHHRHANVTENVCRVRTAYHGGGTFRYIRLEYARHDLPRVQESIGLEEVILTPITSDLKLRAQTIPSALIGGKPLDRQAPLEPSPSRF